MNYWLFIKKSMIWIHSGSFLAKKKRSIHKSQLMPYVSVLTAQHSWVSQHCEVNNPVFENAKLSPIQLWMWPRMLIFFHMSRVRLRKKTNVSNDSCAQSTVITLSLEIMIYLTHTHKKTLFLFFTGRDWKPEAAAWGQDHCHQSWREAENG